VAHGNDGAIHVELLAPGAREKLADRIRLSVPLSIVSPSVLNVLESTGQFSAGTATVSALRRWYALDASAEWDRLRRERETRQQGLGFEVPGELRLR
jgi:hypothetical protein